MPLPNARFLGVCRFIGRMTDRLPAGKRTNLKPDRGDPSIVDGNLQLMRTVGLDPGSRLDRTRFLDMEERFITKTPGTIEEFFAVLIKGTRDNTFLGQFVREFEDAPQLTLEDEEFHFERMASPTATESEASWFGYGLWKGHQKTIVELANEYIDQADGLLELVDLIEAGIVGLLESIKDCSPCREAIENAIAKAARDGRRVKKEDLPIEFFNPPPVEEEMADAIAVNIERRQLLEMALPHLEDKILTLLYKEGLGPQEVAEQLGMTEKEVVAITRGALKKRQQSRQG